MNARQSWATDRGPVSKTKQTPPPEPPKGKSKDNLGGDRTREVTHPGLTSERRGPSGCCFNLPRVLATLTITLAFRSLPNSHRNQRNSKSLCLFHTGCSQEGG